MDGGLLPRRGVTRIVGNVDARELPDLGELSGQLQAWMVLEASALLTRVS